MKPAPDERPETRVRSLGRWCSALFRAACVVVGAVVGAWALPLAGQVVPPPSPGTDSVTVTPGARYEAGSTYRSLFGSGYRELWTTPITVPVVDLSTYRGGVTPNRLGGGMTTRTLHLDDENGRRYVFRSVDKAPVEFEDFEGSVLEEIIQDQVSSFHPTGAPVVSYLLEAVGVLHTEPTFVVVADDPGLEEFRAEFAGMLVLAEERPDDGPDGSRGFAGSRDIVQTDDLFEELEENPEHRVDDAELLRARMVDLLVGDRDRSHNNHLWARFDVRDGVLWRVIPRDRDQAFVRFDGFLKRVAREYDRRLVSFGDVYPDIFALTRNAWDIDRRLLIGLSREEWDAVVRQVQGMLTDDVIAEAVSRMPPEHFDLIGEEMVAALRLRRDRLPRAAEELYRVVFRYADIHGTDAGEALEVTRAAGQVTVRIDLADGSTRFRRVFTPAETDEIRIYLQGGDDRVVLRGGGDDDIVVRVIGGGGRDTFRNESWMPQPRIILYDDGDDTGFPVTGSAKIERSDPDRPLSWFGLDRDLDWGTLTVPQPTASYDADRGLVLVPGLKHDRYGFDKAPYSVRMQAHGGWAFGLNEPIFDLRYLARRALGGGDIRARFRWSGIEIINFYGMGNETFTDQPVAFHRVAHKQVTATVAAGVGDGERRFLEIGPTFTYTSTDTASVASFIGQTDPYGSGKFIHAGARAGFGIDTRDHLGTPTRGVRISAGGSAFPAIFDATESFGEAHAELAGYVSPLGNVLVLAGRLAGKRVWGRFPFTESAFLGGPASVRSIRHQRYAGDAMVLGSAEMRLRVGRIRFPIPSDVGLFGLADAGRVFLEGETSDTWHTAMGGGLWFALINRSNVVRIGVVRGGGRTAVNAGVGFAF